MSDFFADAGAWFDQAGKDIDQGGQDFGETIQDVAQDFGDVFNPDYPNPNSVIDQIETNVDQQPTSGYVVDQIESTNNLQSTPDYVVGPDFNNSAPELLSPVFETFDPLTNPNPGLEVRAFEYGAVGVDALSIDSTNEEESYSRAIELFEEWLELGGGGGYGYMEDLRQQSIEYLLNERLQEAIAENPML